MTEITIPHPEALDNQKAKRRGKLWHGGQTFRDIDRARELRRKKQARYYARHADDIRARRAAKRAASGLPRTYGPGTAWEARTTRYTPPAPNRKPASKRALAAAKVHHALESGRMVMQPCEVCGSAENIHGHHEDYDQPLAVNWLCITCHYRHHTLKRRGQTGLVFLPANVCRSVCQKDGATCK